MSQDISGIIGGTGVALEQQAFKTFGAAVSQQATGTLKDVFNLPGSAPSSATAPPGAQRFWQSTQFAGNLVQTDQVEFNPKLKFLFKVSFEFDPDMIAAASKLNHTLSDVQQKFSFLVRTIERPTWEFDYEEVNLYNFRTKVLKSIKHSDVNFTVYDDIGNNAQAFANVYRQLLQPIARRAQDPFYKHENSGFAFSTDYQSLDTSMRGALPNNKKNVMTRMTIHQIYVERGNHSPKPADWVKVVDFEFTNPRFTKIAFDELDSENGNTVAGLSFSVDFDTIFMANPVNYTQGGAGPVFPSGDIPAGNGSKLNTSAAGATQNPFTNILVQQSSRLVQQSTSNLLNRSLGGSQLGQAVSGQLSPVTGALAQAGKNTISNLLGGGSNWLSKPSSPPVVDSNTPPSVAQSLSSTTSSGDEEIGT